MQKLPARQRVAHLEIAAVHVVALSNGANNALLTAHISGGARDALVAACVGIDAELAERWQVGQRGTGVTGWTGGALGSRER
jgi:hypothetical protein